MKLFKFESVTRTFLHHGWNVRRPPSDTTPEETFTVARFADPMNVRSARGGTRRNHRSEFHWFIHPTLRGR